MENTVKFVGTYFDLIQTVGFYVFFLGLLILIAVILPLFFQKERWVLPSVLAAIIIVCLAALLLEKRGPLLEFGKNTLKVITITREITREVRVPVPVESRYDDRRRFDRQPRPGVSITGAPAADLRPTPAPKPESVPPTQPDATPKPQPQPIPAPPPTPQPQPQPQPRPQPQPQPPSGERTEEGLVLPTGDLIIQVTDTLMMTVPGEATSARLSIIFDGRGIGGRGASSLRKQQDEAGNIINVTYFWKGVTVRLTNQPLGTHRITVVLKVSGNGISQSSTAWSGAVHIGEGSTTIILKGGWGDKLTRVQ